MSLPWTLHGDGRHIAPGAIVAPNERLNWFATIGFGAQHVIAMFGATFLVPLLTGFNPSTTLMFSGLGTMLFLLITRNRVPSYLGSSFAFIAPVVAASKADSPSAALGAVFLTGAALALVGLFVQSVGTKWIGQLLPPVVMGSIVALIGFNLAPAAYNNFKEGPLVGVITLVTVILCTVSFKNLLGRVSILIGVAVGYLVALATGAVDTTNIVNADWLGLPQFTHPTFNLSFLPMFLPVVLVLLAENVGHVTSVAQMTGKNLDHMVGRTLFSDGAATMLSASFGGSATTTYGENIGVMAATRVYSTAAYWVAAIFALLLSLSPKVGAVIMSVPAGVLGGVTFALYGLIGIIGVRMWVDANVDFGKPKNQLTAGVALVVGIADVTWELGDIKLTGIALGTVSAVLIYHVMNGISQWRGTDAESEPAAEETV
ncbi:uracil-xanthine permease family protein [Dermabacteraceae bacterium P13088]